MSLDFPDPPVSIDCDLRDFQFMPLDVVRLRDSELASNFTPEECWAALLLWAAAWHQIPAGSIPEDERWIAKAAGYAHRGRIDPQWEQIKKGALHKFYKCSDGRLYHPVVAEKAVEAYQSKEKYAYKKHCDLIRKQNKDLKSDSPKFKPFPTFEQWKSNGIHKNSSGKIKNSSGKSQVGDGIPAEKPTKGQGQGQGQVRDREGKDILSNDIDISSPSSDDTAEAFAIFQKAAEYAHWPKPRLLDADRRTKLKKRMKEAGGIEGWREMLRHAAKSPFLRGQNPKGWRPGFDFFLSPANLRKIMEGNYDDKGNGSGNRSAKSQAVSDAFAKLHDRVGET